MAVAKPNRLEDRILVLTQIEGADPKSSIGLVDRRIFTGETKLLAVKDPQTCLWYYRYYSGELPGGLKGRFTGFDRLLKYATQYFGKRNIQIKEIID